MEKLVSMKKLVCSRRKQSAIFSRRYRALPKDHRSQIPVFFLP